jgi:hypothetical protein
MTLGESTMHSKSVGVSFLLFSALMLLVDCRSFGGEGVPFFRPLAELVDLPSQRVIPTSFDPSYAGGDVFEGLSGCAQSGEWPCDRQTVSRRRDDLDYMLIGRVNGSNLSVPGESLSGGGYGFDLALHVFENWGVVGSFNANHIDDGSQLVGSLGAVRLPNPQRCDWTDPINFSFFFDQFTDTRVDTVSDSLYLTQIRLQLGYAVRENLEAGLIGSFPTNEVDDVNFLFVNFPNSLPLPGRIDSSRTVAGYVSGKWDELQWSGLAGYRDSPGTFLLAANLRRPINDRLAVFAGGSFEAEEQNWGTVFGLEVNFGPKGGGSRSCDTASCCRYEVPNRIVRAQSPDVLLVNVPPGEVETTPNLDLGRFPQGLGESQVPSFTPPFTPNNTRPWSQRYLNWNTRPLLVLQPSEMWRGLNVNGLTDPVQNQVQKAAGPLKPRGTDRTDGQDSQ